jgi:DNA-binding NarL/FixJ family response regulator
MAARILILEGHAVFGEALRSALLKAKMDVVAVLPTGRDAIAFLERDRPDVILIGLELADSRVNVMKRRPSKSDGLAIGRRILKRWPDANMILMSEWDEPQVLDGALKVGFRGYLSRATPFAEFVTTIRAIVDGGMVFPKTFTGDEPETYPDMSERLSTLTEQEKEVLEFLVEGLDTRTIARRLGISNSEAGDRRRAIFQKLDPRQGLEE